MLPLSTIINQYPQKLQSFPKAILREYLQVKILNSIARHPIHQHICFIGWTALRLMYHSQRFSEDLDFDNRWLTPSMFEEMTAHIVRELQYEGLSVETKHVYKWAFHCSIKIPALLAQNNLAPMATQKLVIKIDTTPQWVDYEPDLSILNRFEHTVWLRTVPLNTLLSMKFRAFFGRIKGRDLFDIVFLLNQWAQPDRGFLNHHEGINNNETLKDRIRTRLETLNLRALHDDVQPFLFDPHDQSVLLFDTIIQQTTFTNEG